MEEKRELPEGVKEEMGACIFCGQTYMFANVGLSTEQLNEAATERCTCEEAKNWQVQRKRAEKVRKKTERIFANDKCLNFMLTSANMILSGGLDKVTVKIGGNASKYWASLEFDDAKGKTHRKEIARERSATKSSNTLQALIDALGILRNPCVLTIYTEDDALAAAWSNGWVNTWQQHSWKNAKGNTIRNAEQWQQLYELMTPHGRRFVCQKA